MRVLTITTTISRPAIRHSRTVMYSGETESWRIVPTTYNGISWRYDWGNAVGQLSHEARSNGSETEYEMTSPAKTEIERVLTQMQLMQAIVDLSAGFDDALRTQQEPEGTENCTPDLAMLVKRLALDIRALADDEGPEASRLSRANAALDYLRRNGLAGSPLREALPIQEAQKAPAFGDPDMPASFDELQAWCFANGHGSDFDQQAFEAWRKAHPIQQAPAQQEPEGARAFDRRTKRLLADCDAAIDAAIQQAPQAEIDAANDIEREMLNAKKLLPPPPLPVELIRKLLGEARSACTDLDDFHARLVRSLLVTGYEG